MAYIMQIIIAAFTAIFVENIVFARALGTSTLIHISRSRANLSGFAVSVVYLTTVTGAVCYGIDIILSGFEHSNLYRPLIYVMVLGIIYVITLLCLWKFFYKAFRKMRKYVHVSAFNCAVLGAMFLNEKYCVSFSDYVIHGIGMGLGFVIAVYLSAIVYERLHSEEVPFCFRGYPAVLIYLGILSMAFYGLAGHSLTY